MIPQTWRHAILHSDLPPVTRHVLLTMACYFTDMDVAARPTLKMIEQHTGLSRPAVIAHMKSARDLGWLAITRTEGAHVKYEYERRTPDVNDVAISPSNKSNGSLLPPVETEAMRLKAEAVKILDYLNESTQRHYAPVNGNLGYIVARLKQGFTPLQLRRVVHARVIEWGNDPKFSKYIRPATLFNETKFAQYAGEIPPE